MAPHAPHLPRLAPIDTYGNGGFRFADMSHRGSLLCLPSGIWAWPVTTAAEIDEEALAPAWAEVGSLDFFLIGTGRDLVPLSPSLRSRFREHACSVDVMATGAALQTFNILLAEGRRVGAALIAVH